MTQTSVSLQIKSLESKLGQNLFIRRPKSLKLTEIGKAYLPTVRDSLLALNLSTNGLFGPDIATTIVIRSPLALTFWLGPKLADFQLQYPGVGFKFVTAIWVDAVDTQPIDIDIVLASDRNSTNHMERLSNEFLVPICGPGSFDSIKSVDDLTRVNPIHILGFDDHWSRYLAEFGLQYDIRSTRLQVDNFVAACEFVACDLGCAVVLERFATIAIETGRQIKCVGERVPLQQSLYLVAKESGAENQLMIEAFKDWLRPLFV